MRRWSTARGSFRSAGFQPASGQDGRSPRQGASGRPETGAAGPVPGGARLKRPPKMKKNCLNLIIPNQMTGDNRAHSWIKDHLLQLYTSTLRKQERSGIMLPRFFSLALLLGALFLFAPPPALAQPTLTGLSLAYGTNGVHAVALSPVFAGTTTSYTASVPYHLPRVYVTPTWAGTGPWVDVGSTRVSRSGNSATVYLADHVDTEISVTLDRGSGNTPRTRTYTITVSRLPRSIPVLLQGHNVVGATLTVAEGSYFAIKAYLGTGLSKDVTIPLTWTSGTAEMGDYETSPSITIFGATQGKRQGSVLLLAKHDADMEHETFTVDIDEANLPTFPPDEKIKLVKRTGPVPVRIFDDEKAVPLTLTATPNPVREGEPVTVTGTLETALTRRFIIHLGVREGTAERSDRTFSSHSISFPVGQRTGTTVIKTHRDADTDDETFTVYPRILPVEIKAGNPGTVQITIRDTGTDVTPAGTPTRLRLAAAPAPAEGGPAVTVTARLDTAAPAPGTEVTLSTTGSTAGSADYTLSSSTITIAAGETEGTATLSIIDDSSDDAGETIVLRATSTNPTLTSNTLTLTIADNDTTTTPTTPTTPTGTTVTGGGGGGTRTPADQHGDTPEDATSLNPRRYTTGVISRTLTAHLQSQRDIDYFTLDLPYAGLLTASTTGADTTGRLYQAHEDGDPRLVTKDTDSGSGRNFRLGSAVKAGTYYLAVSAGASSGEYRLSVHYTPAFVDNPGPDSPQSGVSVLSGWVCEAETVEIEFETPGAASQTWVPATGTSRPDTAVACGPDTTDTGYGLLFNWNRLGDGQHTVRVLIDDVLFAERAITVTTLGPHDDQEFRKDLAALTTAVADFPAAGETTTLRWEQALQNFVIASGEGGGGGKQLTPEQAILGNPAPGSFQSGVGVLSGWVCEADTVELVFETATGEPFTEEAGYGTERGDTEGVCGDTDNGFGLLFNWNRLGGGQHTVRAYADGEAFGHSTFTVTTLGEEFAEDLAQTHEIEDFPAEGQTTTVEWQRGQQNFVITAVQ